MSRFIATLLFMVLAAPSLQAAPLWGTDASSVLSGSRNSTDFPTSEGVIANGAWGEGIFTLSWNISFDGGSGYWTYEYTVDTSNDGQNVGISQFLLEVTDADPFNIISHSSTGDVNGIGLQGPQTWAEQDNNPGLPNELFGVRFNYAADDSGIVTYTLTTDRAPVWGVFFANSIGEEENESIYAYSNALAFADFQTNETLTEIDFIVRPNGATVIPVPAAVWLMGSALIGLIGIRRRS